MACTIWWGYIIVTHRIYERFTIRDSFFCIQCFFLREDTFFIYERIETFSKRGKSIHVWEPFSDTFGITCTECAYLRYFWCLFFCRCAYICFLLFSLRRDDIYWNSGICYFSSEKSIYECHRMYRVPERFILIESYTDCIEKSHTSIFGFSRCEVPVWVKRCITRIDLQMKMWGCSNTCHAHSSYHISLSYDISSLREDSREMEIVRIECLFFSIHIYVIMAYDNKLIPCRISFRNSDYYSVGDREYWCSERSPYINSWVSTSKFLVI